MQVTTADDLGSVIVTLPMPAGLEPLDPLLFNDAPPLEGSDTYAFYGIGADFSTDRLPVEPPQRCVRPRFLVPPPATPPGFRGDYTFGDYSGPYYEGGYYYGVAPLPAALGVPLLPAEGPSAEGADGIYAGAYYSAIAVAPAGAYEYDEAAGSGYVSAVSYGLGVPAANEGADGVFEGAGEAEAGATYYGPYSIPVAPAGAYEYGEAAGSGYESAVSYGLGVPSADEGADGIFEGAGEAEAEATYYGPYAGAGIFEGFGGEGGDGVAPAAAVSNYESALAPAGYSYYTGIYSVPEYYGGAAYAPYGGAAYAPFGAPASGYGTGSSGIVDLATGATYSDDYAAVDYASFSYFGTFDYDYFAAANPRVPADVPPLVWQPACPSVETTRSSVTFRMPSLAAGAHEFTVLAVAVTPGALLPSQCRGCHPGVLRISTAAF